MEANSGPQSGINAWLEEELLQQYHHDRASVDADWKTIFEHEKTNGNGGNGAKHEVQTRALAPVLTGNAATVPSATLPAEPVLSGSEELMPLRGTAARIAENMALSAAIPLATSQRIVPVKVIDENRRLINHHRALLGRSKVSYTHLIGWAIVKSVAANPSLNHSFASNSSGEMFRVVKKEINFGLAIDVAGKNGARSLLVPCIRNAGAMTFAQYLAAFDDLVARGRSGKLGVADFQGTTISLTNPGTVGTMASMPRLVAGQGAIVAVGAMDYPAEYRGAAPDVRAQLGISKVMSVTCTYDHRIIQGAESGLFLGTLQALLDGEQNFYDEIFDALRIPYAPVKWAPDKTPDALAPVPEPSMEVVKGASVIRLINAFRVRGHLMADLDPLGDEPAYNAELDPLTYGLTIWDLDRHFYTDSLAHAFGGRTQATLREMIDCLREVYCGKIGSEYMYIQRPDEKLWLMERMESPEFHYEISREEKLRIFDNLLRAEEFEHFLDRRFIGQKRFSLEGAETTISALTEAANFCAENNVHEMVIGMAHRGRLNVLANIVGKPLGQIFSEFEGNIDPASAQGSGDVKYHLGASGVHRSPSGKEVVVTLAANPSHLEAVNPVVEGMARAKQERLGDSERRRVVPLLVHGDAAFAGQGVVAETLNLSQLEGYSTGGTIHFVINNQIGFTTLPSDSRSTAYATDIARTVQAPIFHVNGDDPEAMMRVLRLAFDYRQQFQRDVVIDMICYRRHGHNEADDPAYTQPVMYRRIKEQASAAVLYGQQLTAAKVLTSAEVEASRKKVADRLNAAFDANKAAGPWVLNPPIAHLPANSTTAISRDMLERVVDGITFLPTSFHIHPKLDGFVKKRRETLAKDGPVDWAYAEAIAFGSLVVEGIPVRLSGQDSGRGTFSQRHLVFYDFEDGHKYIPLQHMTDEDAAGGKFQARFNVVDSSLSEFGVLGFDYGFSVADPQTLTLWEAQFGDFSNGAQIIIDQFITTAEQKWSQRSGLVMLLPHGYEGQGPEHSSARMERFLLLCAEDNIRVANCTTPAQYFHILRRQMATEPKPLVLFTPKSLLRSPAAVSSFNELTSGSFRPVIGDMLDPSRVRKIVFCTGKVYYDLAAAREAKKIEDVALVRIEELYPFPDDLVLDLLARYRTGVEIVWCQEEPRNMGAWRFVYGYFKGLGHIIQYAGRLKNASPAAGSAKRHAAEQKRLVEDALNQGSGATV